tara:strand:- start:8474 stop:10132 length:1659 start_codon:yes stop_codon:yes gene_type:complete
MSTDPRAPHQWPDALHLEGKCDEVDTSLWNCLKQCDRMLGTLIDLTTSGVEALKEVLAVKATFSGTLVIALSSACPTREEDLRQLLHLQDEFQGDGIKLQLRLLPIPSGVTHSARHSVSPPSGLLLQNSKTGQSWLWLGSNGDLDLHRPYHTASLNILLPASALLVDQWCKQFDYVAAKAAPLKAESLQIPNLVPARGEIEAAEQWELYCNSLFESVEGDHTATIEIDPETGEVRAETVDGEPVETASKFNDVEKLSPELSQILPLFGKGFLISVDEGTRIQPLSVPMQSFLFEQRSRTQIGAVTQKQTFSLEILDEKTAKEIEKCRKINPTITLFSFSMGKSIHWIPEAAKELLHAELNAMETEAKELLGNLITGGVDEWIESQWPRLYQDIEQMYQRLHAGTGTPPADRVDDVRKEIKKRLLKALSGDIVPKINYSAFTPQIEGGDRSVSSLGQVLHLLKSAAVDIREPYWSSYYFDRNFTKRKVKPDQWAAAMNVFEDTGPQLLKKSGEDKAKQEKALIEQVYSDTTLSESQKLSQLWAIIRTPIDSQQ